MTKKKTREQPITRLNQREENARLHKEAVAAARKRNAGNRKGEASKKAAPKLGGSKKKAPAKKKAAKAASKKGKSPSKS